MQVHIRRPASNFPSFSNSPNQRPQLHSPQAQPQKRHSFPAVAIFDNAIFRKHIVQSHIFSFSDSNMLTSSNTKSNTLTVHPKPRPLVEQDFEVIGLSDDYEPGSIGVRPPPGAARRASSGSTGSSINPIRTRLQPLQSDYTTAPSTGRDLLVGKPRPSLPITHSSPATLGEHLAPPIRTSRKKKSSTTVRNPTSRHSSPSPPSPRSASLNYASSNGKVCGLPIVGAQYSRSAVRRSSWQPGRRSKTVEEIERECDDDDDDEIPDNTVFWNIPLSPRAGRSLPSGGSKSPSPERLSESSSPRRNSEVNGISKTDRAQTPTPSQSTVSLPSLARSESGDSEPRGRLKSRGKSWGDVMLELGNDAQELTEALERYADESIEAQGKDLQQKVKASRALSTTPPKQDGFKVVLPPKQVSDSIMGALPMSKEKEAALSRTRPGWLPPKPKVEEEKHLKEYQEMMRLSIESDRRRAEKEKQEIANREKQRDAVHKLWDDKVIPNWNQAILEQNTRELWWAGVSPKSRGVAWQRAIGNALAITEETYTIALERARKLEEELNANEDRHPQKDLFADIRKDAGNIFVELKLFQTGAPLHQSLVDVLMAYSVYRKDIGYNFGLHALAANLLLNLPAPDAFQVLANILNRQLPLSFHTRDEQQTTNVYNAFLRTFQYKLPALYQHIHIKLQLPPPLYLEAMFTTLFTLHVPIDIVSRLWDVYAFEGDAFIIRTAVAVLTILEGRLYGEAEEVIALLGWEGTGCMGGGEWRIGKEDEFMTKVRGAGKVEVD